MISDNSPLCCCEYFDVHEERNHILACCNCQDFDEGFDSFISGHGIPNHNKIGFMATLHDRLRIPWRGGAKRVSVEAILSITMVLFFLLIASAGPVWTIISALFMVLFLVYVKLKLYNNMTRFFKVWMQISFFVLYVIFELLVIPLLEILWEENVALSAVIAVSVFCLWQASKRRPAGDRSKNCSLCMTQVPQGSRHAAWLNCCVGSHNYSQYSFGLFAAVLALLYGSNLTLTTVCHPFTWFAMILLPDDCSDAYELFELSLSFVSAIYSIGLAAYLFILLIYQLIPSCAAFNASSAEKKVQDNFIA